MGPLAASGAIGDYKQHLRLHIRCVCIVLVILASIYAHDIVYRKLEYRCLQCRWNIQCFVVPISGKTVLQGTNQGNLIIA